MPDGHGQFGPGGARSNIGREIELSDFSGACGHRIPALSLASLLSWNESELIQASPGLEAGASGGRAAGWSRDGVWSGRPAVSDNARDVMSDLLSDYLPLAIFIAVALGLSAVLLVAPFLVAFKQPDPEKLSAYECGFNAFDDARMKFDVRFYLVAILFIIFDLEVAFLFPWAVAFGQLGAFGFWSMMVFLGVLTIGFAYEWKKGALEWD
jgi:NADH-quinone oxidoreductase subunit A